VQLDEPATPGYGYDPHKAEDLAGEDADSGATGR